MSAIWDLQNRHKTLDDKSLQKAFYHPSPQQRIDPSMKKTKLVPDRNAQHVNDQTDLDYLKGSNIYKPANAKALNWSQDSLSFNESWPDSDRPSTVNQFDQDADCKLEIASERPPDDDYVTKTKPAVNSKESVLQKYVMRFRNAAPQSREERLKSRSVQPNNFWWLHDTSQSGGEEARETQSSEKIAKQTTDNTKLFALNSKLLSSQTQPSLVENWLDGDTLSLQNKADALLERTASSLSSSSHPAVSTIGLGSEPSTSAGSVVAEEPYRPRFTRQIGATSKCVRPEDDILEQWRRRRRMELAKERIQQVETEQRNTFHVQSVENNPFFEDFRRRLTAAGHPSDVIADDNQLSDVVQKSVTKPLIRDVDVQTSFGDNQNANNNGSNDNNDNNGVGDAQSCLSIGCCRCRQPAAKRSPSSCCLSVACPHSLPCSHVMCDVIANDDKRQRWNRGSRGSKQAHNAPGRLSPRDDVSSSAGEWTSDERSSHKDIPSRPQQRREPASLSDQLSGNESTHRQRRTKNKVISNRKLTDGVNKESSRFTPAAIDDAGKYPIKLVSGEGAGRKMSTRDEPIINVDHCQSQRSERGQGQGQLSDERPVLLAPRLATASPTRADNDVIRRTVDDRAFDISDSLTVVSSFENISPLSSPRRSMQLDDQLPVRPKEQQQEHSQDIESVLSSDEEEFCDDNILQDLRQRRALYLSLLRQLDTEILSRHSLN